MPSRVAPTNVWELSEFGLTTASFGVPVYANKDAGRYGFTTVLADNNATLVKDTATGDVHFIDSVNTGTALMLIRGRMAVISMALV